MGNKNLPIEHNSAKRTQYQAQTVGIDSNRLSRLMGEVRSKSLDDGQYAVQYGV